MSSIRLAFSALLFSTMALSSHAASAKQCDEIFQIPDGDEYFHLNKPPIDEGTAQQLHSFADQLRGTWRGKGLEVECGISNGESHSTISNVDIDAEIRQHFLGAIVLHAEKDSRRKVQLEKMFISPELEKQQQGRKIGYRDYSVEFNGPNTMIFDEKYRAHNNGSTNSRRHRTNPSAVFQRMIHEIKSVTLENNTLKINRDLYVNGHFVSNQEWELTRTN